MRQILHTKILDRLHRYAEVNEDDNDDESSD
jgi:hypothetical protein